MAGKSSIFQNDLLKLIFNGTPISGIADNAATTPLTNLYISLHTASPGVHGNQATNEAAYLGYDRVALSRDAGGWTVIGSSVSPTDVVSFPEATAGNEIETYLVVGTASIGTGKILYYGAISPKISVSNGVIPELTTDSTITES